MNFTRRTLLSGLAKLALIAPLATGMRITRAKDPTAWELIEEGWHPNPHSPLNIRLGGYIEPPAQQWYRSVSPGGVPAYGMVRADPSDYITDRLPEAPGVEFLEREEPEPLTAAHFDPVFHGKPARVAVILGPHADEMNAHMIQGHAAVAVARNERGSNAKHSNYTTPA